MNITVKTTYSLDTFKALNRVVSFRGRKPTGFVVLFLLLFVIVIAIALSDRSGDPEVLRGYIMAAGVYGVLAALLLFHMFGLPKIQYKQAKRFGLADITYTFGEESLLTEVVSPNHTGTSEIKYSALLKAVETEKYFFLYQTANQVMIVDKQGIQNGCAEDISLILHNNFGNKFRRIGIK